MARNNAKATIQKREFAQIMPTIPPWARQQHQEHENKVPREVSYKERHKKKPEI